MKKIHKRRPGAIWWSQFTYCGLPAWPDELLVPWEKVTCKNCLRSR